MKDEIKEILDYLKKEVNKFEESKTYLMETYNYREQDIENIEQHKKYVYFKKLLDYITNLQEEKIQLEGKIKQLEHNCKQASDSCRQHRLASKNHIRRLERREQQINIYKSRNEKAIEFVKKESKICYTNQPSENPLKVIGNFMWHTDKLSNILQGEDKDE